MPRCRCCVLLALCLLGVLLTFPEAAGAQDANAGDDLPGAWSAEGNRYRAVFRFKRDEEGAISAFIASRPSDAGRPFSSTAVRGDSVFLKLAPASARFRGALSEDGARIEGTWIQGERSVPLTFTPVQPPEERPPPAAEARDDLRRALDIMQERSINRDSIEWDALRKETMRWARGAETAADTYPALRYATDQLGDNHSFLRPPPPEQEEGSGSDKETDEERRGWEGPAPRGQLLSGAFGYVRVPGFQGGARAQTAFADSLQRIIARLGQQGACGWVVDLRRDTGGNMWPMLAGLGPVLGEGTLGSFVYPSGKEVDWWYYGGKAGNGEQTMAGVSESPYEIAPARPPVAVLTGPRTASSGEAVAVAFRGRPNARSFGQPTRGLSTSNEGVPLSDGARLWLTTSTFLERGDVQREPAPASPVHRDGA